MRLEQLAASTKTIAVQLLGGDVELATQIQIQLGNMGLLDPPADGHFGPVSHWALAQLMTKMKVSNRTVIDAAVARVLLEGENAELFPLNADATTFAGRIVGAALQAKYWLCRHPDCVNIVYLEGVNIDGALNDDAVNEFNDVRAVVRINRAGNPDLVECWDATSEPGRYYTLVKKLDPRGAARVALGQYKAWSVGTHMHGSKTAHEALVQTANIRVHRDMNGDFERANDDVFEGVFGINQHWGYDLPKSDIGRASAGCLVGRTKKGHRAFMALCKSDPRFAANNSYRFMTGVLAGASLR